MRWTSLRDRYVKEYMNMKKGEEHGTEYKSVWRFIKAMSFMADYIDQRT